MTKSTTRKGLSNPAAVAASSPAGVAVMDKAVSIAKGQSETANKIAVSVVPFVVKAVIILGVGYYIYKKVVNQFQKMGINTKLDPANVTDGQADAKANAMYSAMYGLGADMLLVNSQLAGLNYNGWVKVYNAFGNRSGANLLGDEMNLVDWITSQFSGDDLTQLRNTLPGVF